MEVIGLFNDRISFDGVFCGDAQALPVHQHKALVGEGGDREGKVSVVEMKMGKILSVIHVI